MKPYQVVFRPSYEIESAFKDFSFMSKLREELGKGFKRCIGRTDFWIAYSFSKHVIDGETKHGSQIIGCVWLKDGDEAKAQGVIESVAARDSSGASISTFKPLDNVLAVALNVAKSAYAARNYLPGQAYACTSQLEKSAALVYQFARIEGPAHTLEIQGRLAAVRSLERKLLGKRH
jgi:hypothetical protein